MPEPDAPRDALWLGVALACVVSSPAAAYAAQRSDGWTEALLFALQLVVTGMAFLIPQGLAIAAKRRERSSEQRELDARTDTRATINDALDPVLRILGEISAERSKPAREQLIAQAIPFVLTAASNLIGSERSRACWFELTDGDPPSLVPRLAAGRSGSPTTTFTPGDPAGEAAIAMVLRGENLLCPDIDTDPPPGWDTTKPRDYKTFISISVATADTAYGMLTLDALEAGALTNDDLHMLGLMASALAAALAQRT
ncbi:GAF domain-containing protein [Nocardioides renjunii]|uniref:GAF domain-containing protein n=1 Tax=Nocardioides renjunii TaxID=3095075 RepID=UPI002AFE9E15|nr:GAF domain-containing protein [Nocardioides sp. S-34]WQQ21461.1 GAF domain-containing protein [Nocardioides sp. S-34]